MNIALSSISAIAVLMIIGLIFFIRASVKERIEQLTFALTEPTDIFLPKISDYFTNRSYRLIAVDEQNGVTYEGFVRPSWFMAIFLTVLAAGGCLCLGLILSFWLPIVGDRFWLLAVISPLAGFFYWQKSARLEQVKLELAEGEERTTVTVTGHRDELSVLERNMAIRPLPQPE